MEKLKELGFVDYNEFFYYYGGLEVNYWYDKKEKTLTIDTSENDEDFELMPTIKVDVEHCIRIIKTIEQIEE